MMTLRKSVERGPTRIGWLDSLHSFSFGGYRDPRHRGFRNLLVINEDRVAAGAGFPRHGHSDMEILSYVISGALGHRDSTGTDGVIRPGEIQRMTAGTGIEHSEMNASATEPVHFLQIWLLPARRGLTPGYEERTLPGVTGDAHAQLDLIATPDGGPAAVTLHADARLYRASLGSDGVLTLPVKAGRHAWAQVVHGGAAINGQRLDTGDGLALSDTPALDIRDADDRTELLLFDLA